MDGDDPDLALSIPLQSIYEEFMCPICYSCIKDCYITPCGHNFCLDCVKECLNRKHQCPCCNAGVMPQSIIKNHHFSRLVDIIEDEKDKSSKKYFEMLISNAEKHGGQNTGRWNTVEIHDSSADSGSSSSALSPIEQLFHTHMKRSLSAYEEYYQDLKKRKQTAQDELREEMSPRITTLERAVRNSSGVELSAAVHELSKLTEECDLQIAKIQEDFDRSISLLLAGYDSYMETFSPSPTFLPVTVSFLLPSHNLTFERVTLRPTDILADLKRKLAQLCEQRRNPIISEEFSVYVSHPFDKTVGIHEETLIIDPSSAVHRVGIEPGSKIIFRGSVKLKSDLPQKCFTAIYEKDAGQQMDYYTCKQCKCNWICKPCSEHCHAGHEVVAYIANHRPTWACCYCVKNGKCKLENSRSR